MEAAACLVDRSHHGHPGGAGDEAARQELLALFPELEMGGGFAYGSARAQLRRHEGSLLAPPRN